MDNFWNRLLKIFIGPFSDPLNWAGSFVGIQWGAINKTHKASTPLPRLRDL